MKKIYYFIPSLIMMSVIFLFSCQTGTESSQLSSGFLTVVLDIFPFPISEFVLRKIAHMCEYAILTYTFYYGFRHTSSKPLSKALLCSFLYACSDEAHQLFTLGRSGQIIDVVIDTCGSLITLFIIKIYHYIKKR